MAALDLSIVIVSWNVADFLKKCLESIYKNQGDLKLEVIVVDNGSKDNTINMIKKYFPQVILIANDKNLGFAAGNNKGILKSRGEYILALNPDTEILRDALPMMIRFMARKSNVGICGCRHRNPDFTLQPSVRQFPTASALFFIGIKLAKIFPNIPPVWHYLQRGLDYKLAQPVDQVAGSCFLIRRQMINEIGLFDENFFIWFEEVDLCQRAKAAGWQVWYIPDAEIIHYGGQSFKQQLVLKSQRDFFRSALYYFLKHGFSRTK